jgi:hypothetical protein
MVRSVKLENGSGGSYYNLGQGAFCSALINLLSVGMMNDEELQFKVFPNPAAGFFNISLQGAHQLPVTIRLRDLSGRLCLEKQCVSAQPGTFIETIDISKLSAGMYVLELLHGNQISTKKIIAGSETLR